MSIINNCVGVRMPDFDFRQSRVAALDFDIYAGTFCIFVGFCGSRGFQILGLIRSGFVVAARSSQWASSLGCWGYNSGETKLSFDLQQLDCVARPMHRCTVLLNDEIVICATYLIAVANILLRQ